MQQEKKEEQNSLNTEGEGWATELEKLKKEQEHEAQSKALVSTGLHTVTIIFVGLCLFICMVYPVKVTRISKKTFESTYFLLQHK